MQPCRFFRVNFCSSQREIEEIQATCTVKMPQNQCFFIHYRKSVTSNTFQFRDDSESKSAINKTFCGHTGSKRSRAICFFLTWNEITKCVTENEKKVNILITFQFYQLLFLFLTNLYTALNQKQPAKSSVAGTF